MRKSSIRPAGSWECRQNSCRSWLGNSKTEGMTPGIVIPSESEAAVHVIVFTVLLARPLQLSDQTGHTCRFPEDDRLQRQAEQLDKKG